MMYLTYIIDQEHQTLYNTKLLLLFFYNNDRREQYEKKLDKEKI
jgi:hypothetical protein